MLFVGSPQLRNTDDAMRLRLSDGDFAIHDINKEILFPVPPAVLEIASSHATDVTFASDTEKNTRKGIFGVLFPKVLYSRAHMHTRSHMHLHLSLFLLM